MKYYKLDTQSQFTQNNLCLAIGNFDGFHKGHIKILDILKKISKEKKLLSAILSFDPHPREFFNNTSQNFNIYSKDDKIKYLEKFKIDNFIEFKFDKKLSELNANDFVQKILIKKLNINSIVVGKDFRFGKNRSGNFQILQNYEKENNFDVHIIESIMITDNSNKYSSSIIRDNIKNGEIEKANFALDRNWHMKGKVIQGDKRARKINFPTANMLPGTHILPKKGVYCVKVKLNDQIYYGISNFGERPTVDGSKLLLETHIFNFNQDIYGKELTVQFLTFIRPEIKFVNFDELTKQINKDIQKAKKYHKI